SILIEDVHESITNGQRAIGQFLFRDAPDEAVSAVEVFEALLDLEALRLQRAGQRRRVELVALDGGRGEDLAIAIADLLDLALDHAPHRLGQFEIRQPLREPPAL